MPPPEPRSNTTSPGFSVANAVGFPHPSEASLASSGTCPAWEESYRLEVIGSQPDPLDAVAPQQPLPPLLTRKAAWPYLSLTMSLTSVLLMPILSYLPSLTMFCGRTALFRVQHSTYRNWRSS